MGHGTVSSSAQRFFIGQRVYPALSSDVTSIESVTTLDYSKGLVRQMQSLSIASVAAMKVLSTSGSALAVLLDALT